MSIEVVTERDRALPLFPSSYSGDVLRVRCRREGERRWRTFLLVPNEGEGFEELEARAEAAAKAYLQEVTT